jgi:hypothetical protein
MGAQRRCFCPKVPLAKHQTTSRSQGTPFDSPSAYSYATIDSSRQAERQNWSINKEWVNRATCARQGAMATARSAGLSFGLVGVTAATDHPEAAQALLCTGSCSDCNATKAVIEQMSATSALPSTADWWMRQLWTQGLARINASWGFGQILRTNNLAGLLRRRLDDSGKDALVRTDAPELAFRNLSEAVLSRLRPIAASYIGTRATYGGCKLLRLPGRNMTAQEYLSGMWHHDRCGRRLKCFVFLGPVTPASHPPLVVPRTHRIVYYTYERWESTRFDDAHVAQSYAPPLTLQGEVGDGFCFDTNSIHSVSLNGSEARHVAIFEFHDKGLERSFRQSAVRSPPFG